ncbi:MAG: thiamine pyrophosphate-dependent dehydrogenase E1 component subunit alpha [Tepidanaerobacteraceae bacterium]|jgi:pyruvate dehydrogenase E1 component alpha subunit|nr:thiamine pyrophosphate-dependent dehydrogenase E1 component subunit alpha [Thermoanaerobacterales bacterium]
MLSNETLLEMYKKMLLIRNFEEVANEYFTRGLIWGSLHTCIGEEGSVVGAITALNEDDYVGTTHRGHGHVIAKGADIKLMMAELFGKATGYSKGKGGSMHIADMERGILGANGIVGAGNPIACGAALSAQYRGTKQVTLSFFGDGASNQGTFHESINLASAWKLPVVFVNQNNLYAISTPFKTISATKNIADRAVGYGIEGVIADGMDALDVYEKVKAAVEKARNGEGPTLIECKTYRFAPHSKSDREVYRTKDEVLEWRKKCPITRMEKLLLEKGVIKEEDAKKIKEEIAALIEEAVEFAKNSPEPELDELTKDVYYEGE